MANSSLKKELEFVKQTPQHVLVKEHLQLVFRLYKTIFGEVCTNCPSKLPGYIKRLKRVANEPKAEQMEIPKKDMTPPIHRDIKPIGQSDIQYDTGKLFELKIGVYISLFGHQQAYTHWNLTDDIATKMLAENPARKRFFSKLPDDRKLKKLIDEYKKQK